MVAWIIWKVLHDHCILYLGQHQLDCQYLWIRHNYRYNLKLVQHYLLTLKKLSEELLGALVDWRQVYLAYRVIGGTSLPL